MSERKVKVTGAQVKELLANVVDGIYLSRYFDAMTDFYTKYQVTDDGVEISVNKMLTAKLPIDEKMEYFNFAVRSEESEADVKRPYEEWEDSLCFDYKFEISNYMLCFNISEEDKKLTWEQFKELVANEKYVRYSVQNIDGGSIYMNMSHCEILFTDTDNSYFEICAPNACVEFDKSVVENIYNDSIESEDICYRIVFNNGMSDMTIVPERDSKVF